MSKFKSPGGRVCITKVPTFVSKRVAKVQMGNGYMPPRIVKHIATAQVESKDIQRRIIRHAADF